MEMNQIAKKVETRATLERLVVTASQLQQLQKIADMATHRRKPSSSRRRTALRGGITALFSGASGTGKTMAAEALANQLKLDLYRIDLSQVVGKFIGETEKNLRKLFDVAQDSGAILFFDEADSLFGKRSEVKDSHDRYANIETGNLLQQMEAYDGLVILATNMKSARNEALIRRLRFVVDFPMPTKDETYKPAMLQLDPNDSKELSFSLHDTVRQSGLTLDQIAERLKQEYDVDVTRSRLSHIINRGKIRLQRALQILAVCGVNEIEIMGANKKRKL